MNDGWLSDEACLVGMSNPGVPALLIGREKLKDGRGNAEESDAVEGDRLNVELMAGEYIEFAKAALPEDSLRGSEWNEPPILLEVSSSSGTGEERMLDERFGKREGGGTRPNSSKLPWLALSGEPVEIDGCRGETVCTVLSLRAGDSSNGPSF